MTANELEFKFPKLRPHNYKITSPATPRYNCVAFAFGDSRHWWEAGTHGGGAHWPNNTSDTIDGWISIFAAGGYEVTSSREVEAGFEKVAIYISLDDFLPGHVAVSDGRCWKSKLGKVQDIEHSSLDLLEGDQHWEYGVVDRVLRRPIRSRHGRDET